jgi:hypothetical protein
MAKKEMDKDLAQDKAMIKKAFKEHDKQEHKGGPGTKITLKKGGVTGASMRSMGRNLARARNQKPGSK